MYESCLRHPVWVPEINVNPCNSVLQSVLYKNSLTRENGFQGLASVQGGWPIMTVCRLAHSFGEWCVHILAAR
jgi:hypothetical protein